MVAKINVGNSPRGALIYNCNKIKEGEAHILKTNKIWKEGDDTKYTASQLAFIFEQRAAINQNTKNPFVHISLNPSPQDVLTDEQLIKIADEYMQKMGYEGQPYVIFKHEDISRHHLHIVTTNIDDRGKKLDDSYYKYRSKNITNELERKYNLHPADTKKELNVWSPEKVDLTKNISNQMRHTIQHLVKNYSFQSFNEFNALLRLYNIEAEQMKGEANGAKYIGVIYSATNDNKDRIANPIKASKLGRFAGMELITKKCKNSSKNIKEAIPEIRAILANTMVETSTEENLLVALKKKNIDLVLRKNDTGRIYGATIIDHNSKTAMNGSQLGKEFSANRFQELFNNDTTIVETRGNEATQTIQPISFAQVGDGNYILPMQFSSGSSGSAGGKKKKRKKKKIN